MAGAWFVVGLLGLILLTGIAGVYVKIIMPRQIRAQRVRRLAQQQAPSYGKPRTVQRPADNGFRLPVREVDAEADAEAPREAPPVPAGSIVLSEKDLQERLDLALEKGKALAFGALLGAGHLATTVKDKRLSEAKELVFGTSGRVLTRVKPTIDAEAKRCTPAIAPQTTPVAERETNAQFTALAE